MKKVSDYFRDNPRYSRYKKPLEAANVCDTVRLLAHGRFEVVSFRSGLLTLSVSSSAAAANLSFESTQLISEINEKLGENKVEKVRFKIA
ncbi:MAG: DciA family protein [Patescibacteria group bacterium]|jgi:hypothetical protein